MKVEEMHRHTPFELGEPWHTDAALRRTLARIVTTEVRWPATHDHRQSASPPSWDELRRRLDRFSSSVATEARPLYQLLKRPGSEPRLVQYDEWGRRVDRVETHEGWRALLDWTNAKGVIGEAHGHEGQQHYLADAENSAGGRPRLGEAARLYAFARAYLLSPECHVSLCPTSMADGAVRVLELFGTPQQRERYLPLLLRRGPGSWKCGQQMTELAGGSSVEFTQTVAHRLVVAGATSPARPGDLYVLNGFKWFASASDGDAALVLARTSPDLGLGSKGLSLFFVPLLKRHRAPLPEGVRLPDETDADVESPFNGVRVHRLKNKLGTRHVPTAELEYRGSVAELVGQEGRGVAQIAAVLNITRVYSASGSVASVGKALHIARDYATRRKVGSVSLAPERGTAERHATPQTPLRHVPLHAQRLARVAVTHAALSQLLWHVTHLLGKSEAYAGGGAAATTTTAGATAASAEERRRDERRFRLLTPVAKAFCAYRATECVAQCVESLGGQGYMEEVMLGTMLRDGLVERVWEGTPSVLALDVARVHMQTRGAAVREWCEDQLASLSASEASLAASSASSVEAAEAAEAAETVSALREAVGAVQRTYVEEGALLPPRGCADARLARSLLDVVAGVTCGVRLLEQAGWSRGLTTTPSRGEVVGEGCVGDWRVELEVARRWSVPSAGDEAGISSSLATLEAVLGVARGRKRDWESDVAFDDGGRGGGIEAPKTVAAQAVEKSAPLLTSSSSPSSFSSSVGVQAKSRHHGRL